MFKKTIVSLLLVVYLLSLAACSSNREQELTNNEKIQLRFIAYNAQLSREKYLKYLEDALPDIEIVYIYVSMDNYNSILNEQLKSGKGPDIIEVGGDTKSLAKDGYLLEITDKKDEKGERFVERYEQKSLKAFSIGDKNYATPLQSWFEGIFYNKAIFDKYNLQIPKTFEEFIKLHKDLAAEGVIPQIMGASDWQCLMKQSIGIVNNEFYSKYPDLENNEFDEDFDNGHAKLADAWLPSVKIWYEMITEGCLTQEMLSYSNEQALHEFAAGRAAMWESGPWSVNDIFEENPDFELGMFPIPGLTEGSGWLVGGPGSGLAINAGISKEKLEAALRVLEKTATFAAQKALIDDNTGRSFLMLSVSEKEMIYDPTINPIYEDCQKAFADGHVYAPWITAWTYGNAIVEVYGKALQNVLAGTMKKDGTKMTVKDALEAADRINELKRADSQKKMDGNP